MDSDIVTMVDLAFAYREVNELLFFTCVLYYLTMIFHLTGSIEDA